MKSVSRFEANLLGILHFVLGRAPLEQAWPLVAGRCQAPECLTRSAVELIKDSLAKGCMMRIARAGGWRRERHLRGERVVEGRLWERTAPAELGLEFSQQTLDFLIWMTASCPSSPRPPWRFIRKEMTTGDLLLIYFAYDALRDTEAGPSLRKYAPIASHGLCRLAFPEDFAEDTMSPDFLPWTNGAGAGILEAYQVKLADRWVQVERGKRQIEDWQRMRTLGHSQERLLSAFFAALESVGRPDLARFLLEALAALLVPGVKPDLWIARLKESGQRLADRLATKRAALAFLRQLDHLRLWERRARAVGYLDEGYAAAQMWKAEWERWNGETIHGRASDIIRQVEPLSGSR